ncbi:putative dipeptidase SSP1012 [Teleopsis dalmanni]|uniref:putative dipeptidase SSP1012 n=1 Tax=Teleopsis dalmanni TaxID=139649 RepID=UPI0018CF94D7|nr:putative dipeptidase SSP1012 [Teleopsis dalmanni]
MIGKQAHGSTPDVGLNAGTYLANFLTQLVFTGEAAAFLQILGHTAHLDYFGKKMGLAFNQAEMGPLVVNYGLQKFVSGEDGYFSINIRYPIGITEKQMLAIIQRSVKTLHSSVTVKKDELLPHLTPKNDAVIETLLASYETVMGQPTVLHYSTGASYGRLIKRGAAFGTRFAWQTTTAHQANEKYDLENYPKAMAILVESIYRLGNIE